MRLLPVDEHDRELIEAARTTIKRLYKQRKHHIASAIRTSTGKVFTAVHLESHVGRAAICAESAVLSKAVSEGETGFDTVVAVRHPRDYEKNQEIRVVSPCGICRELLTDYAPEIKVLFAENGEIVKTYLKDMLPHKYDH